MLTIYTDGSSLGNPGPGGFAGLIMSDGNKVIVKGGDKMTTNNRMEMSAIIASLAWVAKNMEHQKKVRVVSDSNLLIQTLTKGWRRKKNLDLWKKMDAVTAQFDSIEWQWTPGHAGHKENTEADRIARGEAKKRVITNR